MKNIIRLFAIGAVAFTGVSCEDFLSADPVNRVSAEAFFVSESDLQLYCNGLLESYCPSANTIGMGDSYTDLTASKSGTDYYKPGAAWDAGKQTGWDVGDWRSIRRANIMLRDMVRAKENVSEVVYNHYEGVARFWRAYFYYSKVKTFGNVPWIDQVLDVDNALLYAGRDDREYVMSKVLEDLNFACTYCSTDTKTYKNVINRWVALAFKSRVCLFEGTYRKYHKELNLDGTKFLQECVTACKELLGKYSLYTDNSGESYWKMFTAYDFSNNKEVILGRTYIENEFGHAFQRYYDQNNSNRQSMGATRGFIDEYLCIDGRPIYVGGSEGNYEENPNFEGYGMWRELENRDPRLTQTICRPGEHVTIYEGGIVSLDENGINYPKINYNTNGSTVTGYRVIKHWMGDMEEQDRTTNGIQAAIEFRYGELLLMYAEAKYELEGTLSQADVDMTINALRERAGFDFVKYPTSKLVVGQEPADPRLDKIYAEKLDYPVSPLLREIRRERRVELAMENHRYEDLMRWKAGKLLTVPLRGMRMTDEMLELYSGKYEQKDPSKPGAERFSATKATVDKDIFLDEDGFIICYPKSPYKYTIKGTLPWEDYRYLWPIPREEITMNPQLEQNPGWEEAENDK